MMKLLDHNGIMKNVTNRSEDQLCSQVIKGNEEVINKWYAQIYDQQETQTEDVECLLSVIGEGKKYILEACCGSGRILVPLALAGHEVVGFDVNDTMLERIEEKAKGLNHIQWYHADAIKDEWSTGYDVVVLAGNIIINIESDMEYIAAQELLIQKAYDSLKPGGYVYLDFDLIRCPERVFNEKKERIVFEGTDSCGNYGTMKLLNGHYDSNTRMVTNDRRIELTTGKGDVITKSYTTNKHIPSREHVLNWLKDTGFIIEELYGDYSKRDINEDTWKAIIWAKKEDYKYDNI